MIFCFGELLLRLSPELNRRWLPNAEMHFFLGGAELNAATALAKWKVPVKYFTVLPDNYLSKEICKELKEKKINTSAILFSGGRIGIYYLPHGADLRNAGVIYDREYSSFSQIKTGMINWDEVLKDCSWFHYSAISPALNKNIAQVCKEALKAAKKNGLTISVDLNYRSKLWKYGKRPYEIMPQLVKYCDVVMGNIWSANKLLGIPVDKKINDEKNMTAYFSQASKTSFHILKKIPKVKMVANTFRFDQDGIKYSATLDDGTRQFVSPKFETKKIKDKVGSGDCFMAGLIYGLFNKHPLQDVINYAAAAAFGKLQETGDATNQTVAEVNMIIKNYGKRKFHY
jgi:2-dehydro-3-deoxygluconokinase